MKMGSDPTLGGQQFEQTIINLDSVQRGQPELAEVWNACQDGFDELSE